MCGRFSLAVVKTELMARFRLSGDNWDWSPRYNIAPNQPCITIINEDHKHTVVPMVWGLVPHWTKGKKSGYVLINARAETIISKPSFHSLFMHKRCLIPADGFYEWMHSGTHKTPYRITENGNALFSFAGLWDMWVDDQGKALNTFTIITTKANALLAELHDRMPVILERKDEDLWLDENITDSTKLEALLKPLPAADLTCTKVSSIVNSWRNDSPKCIEPA